MNNIPDFLAHLPIWSNKPMDGVRGVPVQRTRWHIACVTFLKPAAVLADLL